MWKRYAANSRFSTGCTSGSTDPGRALARGGCVAATAPGLAVVLDLEAEIESFATHVVGAGALFDPDLERVVVEASAIDPRRAVDLDADIVELVPGLAIVSFPDRVCGREQQVPSGLVAHRAEFEAGATRRMDGDAAGVQFEARLQVGESFAMGLSDTAGRFPGVEAALKPGSPRFLFGLQPRTGRAVWLVLRGGQCPVHLALESDQAWLGCNEGIELTRFVRTPG